MNNSKARDVKNNEAASEVEDAASVENGRSTKPRKQIVAAVQRGQGEDKQSFWTRVGTAFQNRDGSWNLLLDFIPTDTATTLQLRDIEPRER